MAVIAKIRPGSLVGRTPGKTGQTFLLAVLIGTVMAFLPALGSGQQPTHKRVLVLEFGPADARSASPEKLSQARDILQYRLNQVWPPQGLSDPFTTVAVANNALRVELGPGCEAERAVSLATHVGAIVVTGSDQSLEVGALLEKPEHIIFTHVDLTALPTKPKPDEDGRSWTVPLLFRGEARKRLADYTSSHVGGYFNVLVDGTVLFSAKIMDSMTDGSAVVTANEKEAQELALYLASGPLPIRLTLLSENIGEETTPHASLAERGGNRGGFQWTLSAFVHSIYFDTLGIVLSLGFLLVLFSSRRALASKRLPKQVIVTFVTFVAYLLLRLFVQR